MNNSPASSLVPDPCFDRYVDHLKTMILIREVETSLADGRRLGQIKGPVHLGIGQEAIAVGVSSSLKSSDMVFGAHRSHSHILSLGTDLFQFFSEILGRYTGLCRGKGGSMHLSDPSVGFMGSVPIVAGTVAIAVGAAMAARLSSSSRIAVVYLGDGACEEGIVHESFNLSSIYKEPVLFVVENNYFASHMHISQRQSSDSTSRFAVANNIPFEVVDGNNVIHVANAAHRLTTHMRSSGGPAFIEAFTYRWLGHVDWRADLDVGVNRSKVDVDAWKLKDPILQLHNLMKDLFSWTNADYANLNNSLKSTVLSSWEQALEAPYPPDSSLFDNLYF